MLRCLGIQDTNLANLSAYNFGVIQSVQILEGELAKMHITISDDYGVRGAIASCTIVNCECPLVSL